MSVETEAPLSSPNAAHVEQADTVARGEVADTTNEYGQDRIEEARFNLINELVRAASERGDTSSAAYQLLAERQQWMMDAARDHLEQQAGQVTSESDV